MVAIIVTPVLVKIIVQAAAFPVTLLTTATVNEVVPICTTFMHDMYSNVFTTE